MAKKYTGREKSIINEYSLAMEDAEFDAHLQRLVSRFEVEGGLVNRFAFNFAYSQPTFWF